MNQLWYLYRYILEIIYLNINLMETKEKVLATMKAAGEPLNAGKIAELSGLDRKEVDKAMKQLKEEGAIVSPVRCKWAPAEQLQRLLTCMGGNSGIGVAAFFCADNNELMYLPSYMVGVI